MEKIGCGGCSYDPRSEDIQIEGRKEEGGERRGTAMRVGGGAMEETKGRQGGEMRKPKRGPMEEEEGER